MFSALSLPIMKEESRMLIVSVCIYAFSEMLYMAAPSMTISGILGLTAFICRVKKAGACSEIRQIFAPL